MRRRMLISRCRADRGAGLRIDAIMSLRRTFDAVSPVQAGVEPLRRIWGSHLSRQHVAGLIEKGPRVDLAREVSTLPSPIRPAARQTAEDLPGIGLLFSHRVAGRGATPLQPS